MSDESVELLFDRQRRIERELAVERRLSGQLIQQLGERDVEIARLRESLGQVAVMTQGEVRELALKALGEAGK
jgi:hypothetical protein